MAVRSAAQAQGPTARAALLVSEVGEEFAAGLEFLFLRFPATDADFVVFHEDGVGVEAPVDDAVGVRGLEGLAQLVGDAQTLGG